ncbi:MAG TPA: response regulator [Parafilimonas sp.]|jgi:CheY-like chemotaxis protein|nr:response regulator [Parafilimonas sp.]
MPKVLIINHDEEMMELLKRWLNKKGLQAKYVSEDEALSTMKDFKADVVLVDVLQIEAAKKIKQEQELSNTPIVVMAGYPFIESDYRDVADGVVIKPFYPKEIEETVLKVLSTLVRKQVLLNQP